MGYQQGSVMNDYYIFRLEKKLELTLTLENPGIEFAK